MDRKTIQRNFFLAALACASGALLFGTMALVFLSKGNWLGFFIEGFITYCCISSAIHFFMKNKKQKDKFVKSV
jgi:hypothetical protein